MDTLEQGSLFTPHRLQTQVVFTRNALDMVRYVPQHLAEVPDSLRRLVEKAIGKPTLIQRAMAYMIPTSQLAGLIPLLAQDQDPDIQQAAAQLLSYRLRPRLADYIWQHLQHEPQRLVFSELMLALAHSTLTAHHGLISSDLEPSVRLAIQTLAENNGTPLSVEAFAGAVCQYLAQHECDRYPVAEVLQRYHLDLASSWVRLLLIDTFNQANEASLLVNASILAQWLALTKPVHWPVISHYGETIPPQRWDDRIGRLVEQALADEMIPLEVALTPKAIAHFQSWQKLDSLHRLLQEPRQIELLSRYYYLFLEPAQQISPQTVTIQLTRLVLVLCHGDDHLYLYPTKLFFETKTRWREQEAIKANQASAAEYQDESEIEADDAPDTPADPPEDPDRWPIDQGLIIPARQALLNEQDKRFDEHSLVDELVNNMKVSIIQLFLDDAHYLFARKIFDEIAFFEGQRPV